MKNLPLHTAAQHHASDEVLAALLAANPDAASQKNKNGFMPLHVAVQYDAPPAVTATLTAAYPEAANDKAMEIAQRRCKIVTPAGAAPTAPAEEAPAEEAPAEEAPAEEAPASAEVMPTGSD